MKHLLNAFATVSVFLTTAGAQAQPGYPEKTVRLVAPFPGGSTPDFFGRIVGQKFTEAWGRQVIVENVPGAAGSVAAERVSKSVPDGYTLLFSGDAAMTTNVSLYPRLAYSPLRDFVPIMNFVETPNILVIHPSVPVKDVKELVALAKSRPGQLTYASTGSGTSQHLAGVLLADMASIHIVHIPYKGAAPILTDIVSGRVDMWFGNIVATLPQVRAGKLRGLAVSSLRKSSVISDLPTVADAGYPGFEAVAWFGLLAPSGTPPAVLAKLQQDSARVVAMPDVRAKFSESGGEIIGNSPAEFAAQIKAEIVAKGKLVKASGAKAD